MTKAILSILILISIIQGVSKKYNLSYAKPNPVTLNEIVDNFGRISRHAAKALPGLPITG